MEVNKLKDIMRKATSVTFSKHFHDKKSELSGVDEATILDNLRNPERLLVAEDQGAEAYQPRNR